MAKEKFTLEYDMRSTPVAMLWAYIATANGLKEWFADDAKMDGKEVVLTWNGVEQGLSIVGLRTEKYIRYRWSEDKDKTYFELKITTSELTGNSVLSVTDFAEPDELQEAKDLWNYQMEALQRQLGC
ncbi:MAG: START-like domain-containing protein [Candidatus Limisoma sp.]